MFSLRLGDERRLNAYTFDEFMQLFEEYPYALPIMTHSHWVKNNGLITLDLEISSSGLEIGVSSHEIAVVSGIHDRLAQLFKAHNPPKLKSTTLSRYNLKKSIFLAHRFDEQGKDIAWKLSAFLSRLGFDVVEGEGYETQNIPDKVAARIRSQDILLAVITSGDASWVLSEIAFSKGLNKYIIILCEEGLSFNKGIIGGDYEHLPFPKDRVETTYSDLLYTLPS